MQVIHKAKVKTWFLLLPLLTSSLFLIRVLMYFNCEGIIVNWFIACIFYLISLRIFNYILRLQDQGIIERPKWWLLLDWILLIIIDLGGNCKCSPGCYDASRILLNSLIVAGDARCCLQKWRMTTIGTIIIDFLILYLTARTATTID